MKKNNIIIAVLIVALIVIGWFSLVTQKATQTSSYNTYIKQADDWVERGLYQRAIKNYQMALDEKITEQVYIKAAKAYQARYEETPEDTFEDYIDFLETAVLVYPGNNVLVDDLVELYRIEGEYEDIYECLTNAIENGYNTETVQTALIEAKYAIELRRSEFSDIRQSVGQYYSVLRNKGWNVYNIEEGHLLSSEYEYISLCNEDGTVLVTGEDSRIIDGEGVVLGIFAEKITDAGIFSEGLIAASTGATYSYYNDFAEKQFGEYEQAGMFQDGKAAVKKDGKWMLINDKGEKESEAYEEIILDSYGRYLINDRILVKTTDGNYVLCDEKMKEKAILQCSDVDVYTEDGLIAVCKDGKWGFMNDSGEVVIKPTYSQAKSFSNGLAAVERDGKWGFINRDNILVIDYQFTEVGYVNLEGLCPVRIDELNETNNSEEDEKEQIEEEQIWKIMELVIGIVEE